MNRIKRWYHNALAYYHRLMMNSIQYEDNPLAADEYLWHMERAIHHDFKAGAVK